MAGLSFVAAVAFCGWAAMAWSSDRADKSQIALMRVNETPGHITFFRGTDPYLWRREPVSDPAMDVYQEIFLASAPAGFEEAQDFPVRILVIETFADARQGKFFHHGRLPYTGKPESDFFLRAVVEADKDGSGDARVNAWEFVASGIGQWAIRCASIGRPGPAGPSAAAVARGQARSPAAASPVVSRQPCSRQPCDRAIDEPRRAG